MGYYTRFDLEIQPNPNAEQEMEITLEIASFFGMREEVTIKTHYSEFLEQEMKWYEHDEDMLKLSKKFKDFLFTLGGEGEESGDIWTCYYKNGKKQHEKAKIVQGDFDENKLK